MISRTQQYQQGLSLIELMIAITLSIFITAAMITLFVNSKQNYRLNENMSRLQENGRFAMAFIARDLRMADYRACTVNDRLTPPAAQAISGTDDGGLNNSDTVSITWQTNECDEGFDTDTVVYTIAEGTSGHPSLFRSFNTVNEELVEGIEGLQISYGEDTSGNNAPDYFVDAGDVVNMAQVISVRLTVTARTLETNLTAAGGRITRDFTSTVTLRNRLP